jgi:hypothetical protein
VYSHALASVVKAVERVQSSVPTDTPYADIRLLPEFLGPLGDFFCRTFMRGTRIAKARLRRPFAFNETLAFRGMATASEFFTFFFCVQHSSLPYGYAQQECRLLRGVVEQGAGNHLGFGGFREPPAGGVSRGLAKLH